MFENEGIFLLASLDESHLLRIQRYFNHAEGNRINERRLRDILWKVARVDFSNQEFSVLFSKMNMCRDGEVTWDDFISFLILTYQQKEIKEGFESLEPPIPCLPTLIKSMHRHPVNTIAYSPTVKPDRSISWNDGSVMTCSKDGCINYWSLDMHHERQVQSSCILLNVSTTWVLSMVVMPDVSVVCTSGTERDLRFYDTSARKFELRVMISSIDYAVSAMHYVFSQNVNEDSKLLLGDLRGNIRLLYIQSFARGPFKSKPGLPLLSVRFEEIMKNQIEGFEYVDFGRLHTDFVRQIVWYPALHSIVSCASCPKVAMVMVDITGTRENYSYSIPPKGAWCFTVVDGKHLFLTGGPDCLVRLWNPFVQHRPTATLYGHHAGIVHMVIQDNGRRLYSLSKDKVIKVWDVPRQICLQTYLGLPPDLGEYSDLSTLYNPESRQWIIGSVMISTVPLSPKQDGEHTDGNTHVGGVSVILYNPLYKMIVTCGLDSFIILWNPWDGRRMGVVKDAHTKCMHGEYLPIEITAAVFDPGYQRLLTAAHDGTLKIWNFNTGTCLRNMKVTPSQEITSVIWVKGRIMAVGWNRRVTEFADGSGAIGPGGIFCKSWDLRHKEDISSAVVRVPQTLATATYNGELILWRLETGQAYKQFNVSDPTTRIKIQYKVMKEKRRADGMNVSKKARKSAIQVKKESVSSEEQKFRAAKRGTIMGRNITGAKKLSMVIMPEECVPLRKLAVHCMLFLEYREPQPDVGTLLVALENGSIQVWSHHTSGNFITSFQVVHKAGDYVISMCSSKNNEFLFTGTSIGYVKIWLLVNFATPHKVPICMPKYRLQFPFLWREAFLGRAKRIVSSQPEPKLMNSLRCHRMSTSGIIYIDDAMIFITCSTDCSCRMWTLGGRYIQTIGTFKKWKKLKVGVPLPETFDFSEPPDIKRVASSTTFRVLRGGTLWKQLSRKKIAELAAKERTTVDYSKVYGERLKEPILGKYFKLPDESALPLDIEFDLSFPYIPVYQHLTMPQPDPLERPPTPQRIKDIIRMRIERERNSQKEEEI